MLRSMVRKLLTNVFYKSLPPPSATEEYFLSELHSNFRSMPVFDATKALPSEKEWLSNMNHLRKLILEEDPREFLRWDVVKKAMFVTFERYTFTELKYLKSRPDWKTRWCSAIQESFVGHPIPCIIYPSSSGNLIHHAYHVAKFEEKTKIKAHDLDFVFEFGGGYGSTCRLFHNLGFQGKYIIFDLPAFSALQQYFLKTLGLSVETINEFRKSNSGIVCISDLGQLIDLLKDKIDSRRSILIALWSLSEAPIRIRNSILSFQSAFRSYLIAYQDRFGEVDNLNFFNNLKENNRNVVWHSWQIKHLPGNNYLIGKVSDNL